MSNSPHHDHDTPNSNTCCASVPTNPSLCQNLDEMEFERGPWQAAIDDDLAKLEKLIVNQKICPDLRDSYGYTPLHYAVRNGKLKSTKFLLDHGANVNSQTRNNGATPLHRAIISGKVEIVEILLKNGADTKLKDHDNCTALDRAIRENLSEIIGILQGFESQSVTK